MIITLSLVPLTMRPLHFLFRSSTLTVAFILVSWNIWTSLVLIDDHVTKEAEAMIMPTSNLVHSTPEQIRKADSMDSQVEQDPDNLRKLRSLEYYVEGQWISCAKNETLKVDSRRAGRITDIKDIEGENVDNKTCKGWDDHFRFVPKRLVPIKGANETQQPIELKNDEDYHHFSPEEAATCLKNKRILLIGDSHIRNTWRGLLDTLTGNYQYEYERWDGYFDWPGIPPLKKRVKYILPPNLYPRDNDHSRLGVKDACELRNLTEEAIKSSEWEDKWICKNRDEVNRRRKEFDLREMPYIPIIEKNNITVHGSWCAVSLRNGMETNKFFKLACYDATRGFPGRKPFTNTSHLEQLLTSQEYDIIIMGYHNHDIKRHHCKGKDDEMACRRQLVQDMYQNAETFAKFAKERKLPLVWATSGAISAEDTPIFFRKFQKPKDMSDERREMARIMRSYGHLVLDRFSVSESCREAEAHSEGPWPPCLRDAMHSHRFIDRTYAQMLLNWKCLNESD